MAAMFVAVGRMRGLTLYGQQQTPTPTWTAPILLVAALAAQVALASGCLTLLRAWRLRNEPVISGADARVLASDCSGLSRASAGVVTRRGLADGRGARIPTRGRTRPGPRWAWVHGRISVSWRSGAPAPTPVRSAARALPSSRPAGRAGDLISDLGDWVPRSLTPTRCAVLLATAILVVLSAAGLVTDDPYDGILRGIADGMACMAGFAVLGRYLGLRSSAR